MRFWLKDGVTDVQLQPFQRKKYSWELEGLEVCQFSGKLYLDSNTDFLDPTVELPCNSLFMLIEKVSVKDHCIYRGFRTDGTYRHQGGVLVAKTVSIIYSGDNGWGGTKIERDERQQISIIAPTVEALRAIYSQFRQGTLKPTEDWEANSRPSTANEPTEPSEPNEEVQMAKPGKARVYGIDY